LFTNSRIIFWLEQVCSLQPADTVPIFLQIAPRPCPALCPQAVAFRSTFTNPGPLISIAAALLDLQHDSPALLTAAATAAADAAADQEGALQPEEVISLLLALGFFRVAAPEFVELVLQVGFDNLHLPTLLSHWFVLLMRQQRFRECAQKQLCLEGAIGVLWLQPAIQMLHDYVSFLVMAAAGSWYKAAHGVCASGSHSIVLPFMP